MGTVKANPETLRRLASCIKTTITELENIAKTLKLSSNNLGGWNDAKAAEFSELVNKIGALIIKPRPQLQDSAQRINKMAAALDKYTSVKL